MTTENTTNAAADTATTDAAASTTNTEATEVTLDDVYRDAGLDKIVAAPETRVEQKTEAAPNAAPQKIEPSSIPDAYDTENFKAWLARNAAGTQELHGAVVKIAQHLTAEQQRVAMAATKADIEAAVKSIDETVQIGKPRVIESYLDGEVRADARMKALWENRGKNPTAWQSALGVVAKKMAKEFDLKVDPTLAAAQRARKEAQRTMATKAPEDNSSPVEQELAKAQGADFNRAWESLVSGGA